VTFDTQQASQAKSDGRFQATGKPALSFGYEWRVLATGPFQTTDTEYFSNIGIVNFASQ